MAPERQYPITIVGLGPGGRENLTIGARSALAEARTVLLRTGRHPGADDLPTDGDIRTCDDLYEAAESFDAVYEAIAERVVAAAGEGPVVYAVPGAPAVGEAAAARIRSRAAAAGIAVRILPAVSFVGPTLAALGWDALDGLQVADATALACRHHPDLDPDRPALVAQTYARSVASDVKLSLLHVYPPEHPVTVVRAAGTPDERQETVALADLDRADRFDDRTTLGVPPLPRPGSLAALADVVAHLRAPDGCPWDREQTHQSLRPYLLEETYEVLHALDAGDDLALADELGDVLLQIVLHAQLAVEEDRFTLADVIAGITEKIVRRHPHVFGDVAVTGSDEVRANWEALKRTEREGRGNEDPLAGLPPALPALARAQAAQRKLADAARGSGRGAAGVPNPHAARLAGCLGARPEGLEERERRVGEALWGLVALAADWGVDAETALREATALAAAPPITTGKDAES